MQHGFVLHVCIAIAAEFTYNVFIKNWRQI